MCEDILVYLFGYGSLIYRPGFPYVRKFNAYIKGWKRFFYQGSTDHRGTVGAPGRVVTLLEQPKDYTQDDWITWGTVYAIPDEEAEVILKNLDYREKGGYQRVETDIYINGKSESHGKAIVYLANTDNDEFLGEDTLDNIAHQIFRSVGPSGRNLDYLLKLSHSLKQMEIIDDHVYALEERVLELMKQHNIYIPQNGNYNSPTTPTTCINTTAPSNQIESGSSVSSDTALSSSPTSQIGSEVSNATLALQKKYFVQPKGSIVIDDGCVQAISQRAKSVLAVGVKEVIGEFECGSLVSIYDSNGSEISRGICTYSSIEIKRLIGTHSQLIKDILGFTRGESIIENRNLILL